MGKSLQPQNAMAVRTPANSQVTAAPAASEPVTAESLGWQLRAALPPLRLHSVSLYDHKANVLWLSEGALGPDEHGLVVEALERLSAATSQHCYENSLEDGRVAIFLPVRAPKRDLVGLAMILADIKSVGDGVLERMVSPPVRAIMQRVAVLLSPMAGRVASTDSTGLTLELTANRLAMAERMAAAMSTAPAGKPRVTSSAAESLPAHPVKDILELELAPDPPPGGPAATGKSRTQPSPAMTGTSRSLGLDPASVILEVQPFVKLRAGGRSRRFEVLARTPLRDSAALDVLTLQRLLSWLGAHRAAWNAEPTSFTFNLSISTLEDERFLQHVAACLKSNGIAAETLGFEIAEPLCVQRRAQVEHFIALCEQLGCFVVIDDFSFDSAVLPLLRSKALRLVKIDPKLTSAAIRDKLAQATVVAIVQAVKVLGIHCSAKRIESQGSLQWLTAVGCDFAQGTALAQLQPLEALASAQAT
ncbi:MAG: EAL domain-containing protein [Gammaproteobacteria bacterium]|nr:MAG: EAL domain-containing protein [Gammaproteobacteria bacterium]